MSRGKMKQRPPFARAFKRCTNKKNVDKVAVFDVDKDEVDYVNIYAPESSHPRMKRSTEQQNKPTVDDLIDIDDDEGNTGLKNENITSTATSRDCHQPSTSYHPCFDIEDDECQMVFDKGKKPMDSENDMKSAANSSRIFPSFRRFSVNNNTRNYFKNGTCESEMYISDTSDEEFLESEDSDCEIINDSSGIESWERAAKKKRKQDPATDSESNSTRESIDESSIPFYDKKSEKHNVEPSYHQKQSVDCSNLRYVKTVHCAFDTSKNPPLSDELESFAACPDDMTTQASNATPVFSVTDDSNHQAHTMQLNVKKLAHCDAPLRHSLDKMPTISALDREPISLFESMAEKVLCGLHSIKPRSDSRLVHPEPESENNLMGEREKHKESEEYKRAAEAEWASRQEQLRIQAEEVQRLRKRKKAENLRLLEMEKRQKQRVEEVRESQKRVEETVNLKEKIRADIRNELARMEFLYHDMPSLLRALGVAVSGGQFPSSQEIHAAYKRAALRFHPDRVSRTDVRQQVEAEEKFKLISRMKDKLLPGTW